MAKSYSYTSKRVFDNSAHAVDKGTANVVFEISLNAIGKDNSDFEYLVANEWVSAKIASFLQLPIPPFGLFRKNTRDSTMFASINFEGDTTPADVYPGILCQSFPDLCTGILFFDVLIANPDRHTGNIQVDNPQKPKIVNVFDHDRALFHCYPGEGVKHLKKIRDDPFLGQHCIPRFLETWDYFPKWQQKVSSIPEWFIEEICSSVMYEGVSKKESEELHRFLIHRRDNLFALLSKEKSLFVRFDSWPMTL